jgi:CBS domain-containing protein
VLDAVKLLVNCHVSALPVVDETGTMLGIVSEADVICLQPGDVWLRRERKVVDVMTHPVVSATASISRGP